MVWLTAGKQINNSNLNKKSIINQSRRVQFYWYDHYCSFLKRKFNGSFQQIDSKYIVLPSCDCFQLSVCFLNSIDSHEKKIVGSLLARFYWISFLFARSGGLYLLDILTELALQGYFICITETTDFRGSGACNQACRYPTLTECINNSINVSICVEQTPDRFKINKLF